MTMVEACKALKEFVGTAQLSVLREMLTGEESEFCQE